MIGGPTNILLFGQMVYKFFKGGISQQYFALKKEDYYKRKDRQSQ